LIQQGKEVSVVSRKKIVVVIKQGKGRVIISKKDSTIYGKFSPFYEKKRGGEPNNMVNYIF
jgi:hypothetical protein